MRGLARGDLPSVGRLFRPRSPSSALLSCFSSVSNEKDLTTRESGAIRRNRICPGPWRLHRRGWFGLSPVRGSRLDRRLCSANVIMEPRWRPAKQRCPDPATAPSVDLGWRAVAMGRIAADLGCSSFREEPKVRRLFAGGKRIRTPGPTYTEKPLCDALGVQKRKYCHALSRSHARFTEGADATFETAFSRPFFVLEEECDEIGSPLDQADKLRWC